MRLRLQVILLGCVLAVGLALMILVGRVAFEERGPSGAGTGFDPYSYSEETLDRFDRLLADPGWSRATPGRNPQGMLQAVHAGTGLTFVLIPEGIYRMGSVIPGASDETPVEGVEVDALLVSTTECTVTAWEEGRRAEADPSAGDTGTDGQRPLSGVSWIEATNWCERTLPELSLPSEAEWEYACRAGSESRFSFGDDGRLLGEYGWYSGNGAGEPHPVGLKRPNGWGIYDMHGNVWEWCRDPYLAGSGDVSDTVRKVYRGGSFLNIAFNCRSANRSRDYPDSDYRYLGFRPVAVLPPP